MSAALLHRMDIGVDITKAPPAPVVAILEDAAHAITRPGSKALHSALARATPLHAYRLAVVAILAVRAYLHAEGAIPEGVDVIRAWADAPATTAEDVAAVLRTVAIGLRAAGGPTW